MKKIQPPKKEFSLAGYSALIDMYSLSVPMPTQLSAIGVKHKVFTLNEWKIFTPRHKPKENTLQTHLTFALKYEGLDLHILKAVFEKDVQHEITEMVRKEPTSSYSRRIWFLYEWLTGESLDLSNANSGNYVDVVDDKLQYPGPIRPSKRHKVRNNLPGTRSFCPLIRKTKKIENFLNQDFRRLAFDKIKDIHPDILARASSFLMLEDSKASFAIEGEGFIQKRTENWANIIGKAGSTALSEDMFIQLQKDVIGDIRFIKMGFRDEGGFIGRHDRSTGIPIPDHISAKPEDLPSLMRGLIEADKLLEKSEYHPIFSVAAIAFGFVFIHPFEDGNGRIHRYLMHHVLATSEFTPKGVVFPISNTILDKLHEYKKTLESYSKPRLEFINWNMTESKNVHVTNNTIDLYRYFDATEQTEFIFECVSQTISETFPNEISFLKKYDEMKVFITNFIEMPKEKIELLINFLYQNQGHLSLRAKRKEFKDLLEREIHILESKFQEIFYS